MEESENFEIAEKFEIITNSSKINNRRRRRKRLDKDFITYSSNDEINTSQINENDEILVNSYEVNDIGIYKCTEADCGKEFEDKISLRKHIMNHGEKLFTCNYPECGKKFLDNSKLRRHSLVHTV